MLPPPPSRPVRVARVGFGGASLSEAGSNESSVRGFQRWLVERVGKSIDQYAFADQNGDEQTARNQSKKQRAGGAKVGQFTREQKPSLRLGPHTPAELCAVEDVLFACGEFWDGRYDPVGDVFFFRLG
jgi:hypothetical protein